MISNAHVVMPVITAQTSPWMHQEIGYAVARGIPVLPIAVGKTPGEFIAQLQALEFDELLTDFEKKVSVAELEKLICRNGRKPKRLHHVADWPEQRAQAIAEYASDAETCGGGCCSVVRQEGGLSSFSLPDAEIQSPIWSDREGDRIRSQYHRTLQREERRALERHARAVGCRLVIADPRAVRVDAEDAQRKTLAQAARLWTLAQFLDSMRSSNQCDVVISKRATDGNLLILGNWWVAESRAIRSGGYRQTVFVWHGPTAHCRAQAFDHEFEAASGAPGAISGCDRVFQEIVEALKRLGVSEYQV